MRAQPIGVFDSGVGGLSILREIRRQRPGENVLYFADQAHVPYGLRELSEVRSLSTEIARFLLAEGAKLIVLACNTASAAALHHLRTTFPEVPFVGMEPAVKPAASSTRSRRVGVLATPATFQGALFASVVERFAAGVEVVPMALPGLVERIEQGDLHSPVTRALLEQPVSELLEQRVDTIVLACTHYPFIIPLLQELTGDTVQIIDPSPAIARQAGRLLDSLNLATASNRRGHLTYFSSAEVARLGIMAQRLIHDPGDLIEVRWVGERLGRS